MLPDIRLDRARKLAFIGDSRNDENLVVAQLHLAFLQLHNAVADRMTGSADERFRSARRLVQWHYRGLVVERHLAAICNPSTLATVKAADASRYSAFVTANGGIVDDHAPPPLEFSVAAFRFGQS